MWTLEGWFFQCQWQFGLQDLKVLGVWIIGHLCHWPKVVQEEWLMGSWNKRPDLLQQVRWERMMFVLSMNRFNHLVYNIGGELKGFLSQLHEWGGAGFRKGGGDLPGLGFPPPSRSGRTLKPRRTITVGSNKACNLETGVVDGRSTTSGGTRPVGCRLLALTSRGGSDPSMAMCCKMAVLRPCIISAGYRLKSDEFIPGARSCFSMM